jgi:Domain of unknown function (DUF1707)
MAATRPDLRVGDAERELTAGSLREHYAQGRLSTDELSDRLDATFAATTQGQLAQVTRDLPYLQPAPPRPVPSASPASSRRWMAVGAAKAVARFAALIALLVAAVLVLHISGHDLPHGIIVLVVALFVLRGIFGHRHGHRHGDGDVHAGRDGVDGHASPAVRSRQHGHGPHHEHRHGHGGRSNSYTSEHPGSADADQHPGESR